MPEVRSASNILLDTERLAAAMKDDPHSAVMQIRAAAVAGEVESQALLGQIYCEGRAVALDAEEGLHWYRLAANSGHGRSMNMVGRCHELGVGTRVNAELAAAWYRKAAMAGLDWGMYNYANLLATGRGIQENRADALAWYERAALLGHAKSMNLVGRYLEEGWEVSADPEAALAWYRKSAAAGDFRGQASYAHVLAQLGRIDEAAIWLRRAVASGSQPFLEHLSRELAESPHAVLRSISQSVRDRIVRTRVDRDSLAAGS